MDDDSLSWLNAELSRAEASVADLRPQCAKEIVWANPDARKTGLSIVYLHGFSASKQELRPMPDIVASALGANLFYARLTGHGRAGNSMAEASLDAWIEDLEEALQIGRMIGHEVIVMACSTGATLATLALTEDALLERLKGMVLISPNFGVNHPLAALLNWPFAKWWLPLLSGKERSFEPRNPQHAAFWTTRYPTRAIFPMAQLVKIATSQNFRRVTLPAQFIYSEDDQVVNTEATRLIAGDWGVSRVQPDLTDQDDENAHVIAGEILSPTQTAPIARKIIEWVRAL